MQTNPFHIFFWSTLLFIFWTIQEVYSQEASLISPADSNKTVLILNSYHPETKWSAEIVTELQSALKRQFPDIHIYSGNLNIEEAQNTSTTRLALRAIIWQMAEQEGDTINPENPKIYSLYKIKKRPDVIVCIGEEAYFEHAAQHLWQGEWDRIPLVCCGLNDSIVRPFWHPGVPMVINKLHSIFDKDNKKNAFGPTSEEKKQEIANTMAEIGLRLSDKAQCMENGDTIYLTQYHITGVFFENPIRENLQLIKNLMPDLKEIVWVDNRYYKNTYALYKLRQELPRLLPNTKLTVIHHDRLNTDSIFDVMLQPVKNRIFITYAWNINGVYSRRAEKEIDSLFTHVLCSPIVTLTERHINKNYWLGGVHIPIDAIVKPTLKQITQILNGIPADSIPFTQVVQPEIHLSVPALKHFRLENRAKQIKNVIYKNIPPSFYQQNEKAILISCLILIILSGYAILISKQLIYNKKIQAEYMNYHKLYKRLQTIYQNADLDIALYDRQGILLSRIIDGQENKFSDTPEEILSGNLFANPYLSATNMEMLRKGQIINEEIEIGGSVPPNPHKAEKSKWNLIIKPLKKTSTQQAHYIAIAMDMTPLFRERKAKERTEHVLRFASETAGVGVASYNLLTEKGFASPTWYQNLNEPLEKNSLPTYIHVREEDRKALLTYQQRIRKEYVSTPFIQTIQVKDQEGRNHYVQEYIFVREFAPERQLISVIELNLNYDEPKQKENELRLAKERAELSNWETEQFLANISHEIRTPLNVIVGFSSILANSTDEEEINELTPIIEQNNNLLMALIDNILYLSKLDSDTLIFTYTLTDPYSLFNSLADYARKEAESKDIEILLSLPSNPAPLNLAETQFRLIMINLISNAVKFTTQGTITIGYEKKESHYYYFVRDSGCGIHIINQENIFKRFNKLDVFTQGTGLGLALCRSIVLHQQGQIGVTSTPGQGSTFWFTLPDPPLSTH